MASADRTFTVKDMGMKAIEERFRALSRGSVVVGYPGDGPMHEGGEMPVAALAIVHEYGVPDRNIPARPFIGIGDQDRGEIMDIIAQFLTSPSA